MKLENLRNLLFFYFENDSFQNLTIWKIWQMIKYFECSSNFKENNKK